MKKFLLLMLMTPLISLAEPFAMQAEFICDKSENVLKTIIEEFKESPIWVGQSTNSSVLILVNKETTKWTALQFNKDIACVVASGETFRFSIEDLLRVQSEKEKLSVSK